MNSRRKSPLGSIVSAPPTHLDGASRSGCIGGCGDGRRGRRGHRNNHHCGTMAGPAFAQRSSTPRRWRSSVVERQRPKKAEDARNAVERLALMAHAVLHCVSTANASAVVVRLRRHRIKRDLGGRPFARRRDRLLGYRRVPRGRGLTAVDDKLPVLVAQQARPWLYLVRRGLVVERLHVCAPGKKHAGKNEYDDAKCSRHYRRPSIGCLI